MRDGALGVEARGRGMRRDCVSKGKGWGVSVEARGRGLNNES